MKRLMPAGLVSFLQNNRNMEKADLFVIELPNGETLYATSGQWDITVPSGAGGWPGGTTVFSATEYGRWSRGTITSEATFNLSSNTMALSCAPQPATAYPGIPLGILNAALNGLFDAAQVTVYTAYFAMGQYGKLAGGVVSPPPTFVLSETANSAEFGSTVSTTAVDTGNASIDFIVLCITTYDSKFSEVTIADTINGVASGNSWTAATPNPSSGMSVSGIPLFYYCYSPNTGINHVWTITVSGNGNPSITVMAFTGMPTEGTQERAYGWFDEGGNYGPIPSCEVTAGLGVQSPNNAGDLLIAVAGIGDIPGQTVMVDSDITIVGNSHPYTTAGITAGYLVTSVGAVACTGAVDVSSGGAVTLIGVQSVAQFVGQQACTGNVVISGPFQAAISVADETGFTPGMVVYMNGFTGVAGSDLNTVQGNVLSTSTGVINVLLTVNLTPASYTGQSGTVSQVITLQGFTGSGLSPINDATDAYVISVASGTLTVNTVDATNGSYTGQTGASVGVPINPIWSWTGGVIANETGSGMIFFPGNPSSTGAGGIETKFKGTITSIVDINRVHVEFEVGDPLYLLNMKVPRRLMQPSCPWSVTDENCTLNAAGVDINGFNMTQNFTLASGTQYLLFPVTPFVQPEGYFTQGVVTCISGNNAGLSQTVKLHASGELQMLNPWLLPVAPGDTFSVLVGCDHTPSTCTLKFGNLINFGGTPFVPPSETAI